MSTNINLILDSGILAAFLPVANAALTGMIIQEWLALAFAAAIMTHLLFHKTATNSKVHSRNQWR